MEGLKVIFPKTAHDCVAVFHVLHHTTHCSDIKVNLSHCGLTDKLLKELTDILSSVGGKLQIRELSLYSNKITGNGITDLFNRASASFFSSLKRLYLSNNSITNISLHFSSCNVLTVLQLSYNPLGVSGIQSLEIAVQEGALVSLRELYLSSTLTNDADINGALLATLSPSIATFCPYLWNLSLSTNNLGVPGASALGGLYTVSRNTLRLELSDADINAEAACPFTVLTISNKRLCDRTLILSNNPLGYDGLLVVFKMLRSETCPVATLDLANTDLTTPVNAKSQSRLLNESSLLNLGPVFENSRLTVLSFAENNFSGNKILILAESVRMCKSLSELSCQRCSLASREIIKILDHCSGSSHKNLKVWDLENNFIDDKGVNAFIECLPELFPNLEEVELWGNSVNDWVKERLEERLKVSFE